MNLAAPEPPPAGIAGFVRLDAFAPGEPAPVLSGDHRRDQFPLFGPGIRLPLLDSTLGCEFEPIGVRPAHATAQPAPPACWMTSLQATTDGLPIPGVAGEPLAAAADLEPEMADGIAAAPAPANSAVRPQALAVDEFIPTYRSVPLQAPRLQAARLSAAGAAPYSMGVAVGASATYLAGVLALPLPVELPRLTLQASALRGVRHGGPLPAALAVQMEQMRANHAAPNQPLGAPAPLSPSMPLFSLERGVARESVALPKAANRGSGMALAGPAAPTAASLCLPGTGGVGGVIPSAEFCYALERAGDPPMAGPVFAALQPSAPIGTVRYDVGAATMAPAVALPPVFAAEGRKRMPSAEGFLAESAELAAGRRARSETAPFLEARIDAFRPALPFGLAQPPAPHPADLSPDAVAAAPAPCQLLPSIAPVSTTLPAFALGPELLPARGLALSFVRPRVAAPVTAQPLAPSGTTALPSSAVAIEATGMEALFAPLPPQTAEVEPVTAPAPAPWLAVDPLPAVSAAQPTSLPMAPAASNWPVAPPAPAFSSAARLEFAHPDADTGALPDVPAPAMDAAAPLLAGPVAVELYVQRGPGATAHSSDWFMPRIEVCLPGASVAAVPFAPEQPRKPEAPKARPIARARSERAYWAQGLAAAVAVCAFLYFGSVALRSKGEKQNELAAMSTASDPIALKAPPVAPKGDGITQRVHRAIASRAKLEVGTDFRDGRDFWNGSTPNWGKGWQRHPDGYSKPGALALLRPTLQLTDYRMEFLGQIESKSMSWVLRAHDTDNYYAMKLNVVAPGLRPIVSVVRYAVVNGKRGRKVEIPLPIMMHNNSPYHVAVEVRGSSFVTSVEGETVDVFRDEAPSRGGVGFFSDGAERARVYWVRVTNNDDLLGRICAYITGKRGGPAEAAFSAGGCFNGETDRRIPVEKACLPPAEWIRRRRAGPGWTTAARAV